MSISSLKVGCRVAACLNPVTAMTAPPTIAISKLASSLRGKKLGGQATSGCDMALLLRRSNVSGSTKLMAGVVASCFSLLYWPSWLILEKLEMSGLAKSHAGAVALSFSCFVCAPDSQLNRGRPRQQTVTLQGYSHMAEVWKSLEQHMRPTNPTPPYAQRSKVGKPQRRPPRKQKHPQPWGRYCSHQYHSYHMHQHTGSGGFISNADTCNALTFGAAVGEAAFAFLIRHITPYFLICPISV